MTLVAGVFALAAKDANSSYFLIAYLPTILFWILDSYYLLQERLYRSLYDEVRGKDNDVIDFSLKATSDQFKSKKNCYCSCLFSVTEIGFYLPLLLVCIIVVCVTCC